MQTTQNRGEAYSSRSNTEPFLAICLHCHKHHLRTEDRRAPMLAATATTCLRPTLFRGLTRQLPRGDTTVNEIRLTVYRGLCPRL